MSGSPNSDWPEELRLPPTREIDLHPPLSDRGRQALVTFVENSNARILEYRPKLGPKSWATETALLSERDLDYICKAVVTLSYDNGDFWTPVQRNHVTSDSFADVRYLEPIQLVRLLLLCRRLVPDGEISWIDGRTFTEYRAETGRDLSLRDLGRLLEAVGLSPDLVARSYLDAWQPCLRWGPQATWPYFAERLELLAAALEGKRQRSFVTHVLTIRPEGSEYSEETRDSAPYCVSNALDALDCFPRVPGPLRDALWAMATGTAKTYRGRAQHVLAKEPGTPDRVREELGSSRSTKRGIVSEWLANRCDDQAVPMLREALTKEKNDQARDAMMSALEALGVSLEGILDPDEIETTAARNLARKGVPGALVWVPFDQLPVVRWRQSNNEISRLTVTWWLMQAHRLKSPEPGALLRRQLALVHPSDRESLGLAVLKAWIDFDTMPPTLAEARAAAKQRHRYYEGLAERYGDVYFQVPSLEDFVAQFVNEPGGSAIKFKGLLAISAACGGEGTAGIAVDYIRKWYGQRAAQSKALVRMLSWIEHPTAVQFLTATAKSFRTKGIRDEAYKSLEALAGRRNWTVDQLADRMVPDAGLDRDGTLILDFGGRRFAAELDPGMRLQVRDDDGKLRKDLPRLGKRDDERLATEARSAFSRAKKQIRSVVKEQTDRLFSAMCSGREWQLSDCESDLIAHPIVGRLCRRLVWRAAASGSIRTLRPRGARAWVDAASRVVKLPAETRLSIAHDVNTPADHAVPWLTHLDDHAIEPLFPQFNRGLPDLSELPSGASSIDDFEGYLIGGLALRGAARRLGYRPGETIDGPTFYDYRKSFPTLRLEAHIEFTGQDIVDLDQTVAIERMVFQTLPNPMEDRPSCDQLTLEQVPRIFLLESFRDLREIAEAGDGHDSEWRRKTNR